MDHPLYGPKGIAWRPRRLLLLSERSRRTRCCGGPGNRIHWHPFGETHRRWRRLDTSCPLPWEESRAVIFNGSAQLEELRPEFHGVLRLDLQGLNPRFLSPASVNIQGAPARACSCGALVF